MRVIVVDNSFRRRYKKFLKTRPETKDKLLSVFKKLQEDVNESSLYTHKLTGELRKFYACRITYDLRLVFNYDDENIYLVDIGSHDEVY